MMGKREHIESFLDELDSTLSYGEVKDALISVFERTYVTRLLETSGGNLSLAARSVRMDRKHLHDLMKKHGLKRIPSKVGTATDD